MRRALRGLKLRLVMRRRQLVRRLVLSLRAHLRLDEDDIRDQMIGGLKQDNEAMAQVISQIVPLLNSAADRLGFYERTVPQLRKAKEAYERELRRVRKARKVKDPQKDPQPS